MGYPYFECRCCSELVCDEDPEDIFVNVLVYIDGKEQWGSICDQCFSEYKTQFVSAEKESDYKYRLIGKIPWYIQSMAEAPCNKM